MIKVIPGEWFLVDPQHPVCPSWCRTSQPPFDHKQRCRRCSPRRHAATSPFRCPGTLASERQTWCHQAVEQEQSALAHFLSDVPSIQRCRFWREWSYRGVGPVGVIKAEALAVLFLLGVNDSWQQNHRSSDLEFSLLNVTFVLKWEKHLSLPVWLGIRG